jgi:protein-S-isoprenylcysteine O-methyltransferase Ste14
VVERRSVLRNGIVRNAIREDVLVFALPAFFVYCAGLVVSAWHLVSQQESLFVLSVQCIVGLALIGIGFAILFVSVGTLRRSYSSTLVVREDHQIITHGIYRFTRHPIYLGAILVCVGVPVSVSSVYGFLIMAALVPLILNRIRIEERMLTEEFGDEYRAYKESTRKLIPFIY